MSKKIIIGGSMKFRDLIKETMGRFKNLGITALFPNIDYTSENRDVACDENEKLKLARGHYRAIEEADAVYFILPKGYMGSSCKIELGYALALKKPIYFSEETGEMDLDCYCEKIIPLGRLEMFMDE
ncbi:MAG: nucleoside 2-deoxyribosyltransferase [bacterium]